MDDVTKRLRMSTEPESVERERVMAGNLFGEWMREREGMLNPETIRLGAKRAIEASCIFWEQWDIATLTPDMAIEERSEYVTEQCHPKPEDQ